ncbi:polysaccharide pyruvyl transferase family protein [Vibrio diabolicus]|uniref:polysaccharide pyruvyl transferase family protein n=1 Tax=Vibrio diabolicus TaxID=50719 RepID=UPI0037521AF7
MTKRVCLVGYYGYGNFGDDLMLGILVDVFKKLNCSITVITKRKCDFLSDDVTQVIPGSLSLSTIYSDTFSKSDVVVWGGGTCFYTSNNNIKGMLGVLKRVLIAKRHGCKFNFLGVGVEPTKSLLGRIIYKCILLLSDDIICRDKASFQVLCDYSKESLVHSDLTYLLNPINRTSKIELDYIAFFPAGYANAFDNINSIVQLLCEVYEYYKKKIVLVSLHDGIDEKFNLDVYKRLYSKIPIELSHSKSVEERTKILSGSYFNIGMRLHSVILSDVFNVPVFSIAYQRKVSDYLERVNCLEYKRYVDINERYDIRDIVISINEQFCSVRVKKYVDLERQLLLNCTEKLLLGV